LELGLELGLKKGLGISFKLVDSDSFFSFSFLVGGWDMWYDMDGYGTDD
jgi:hypothetical protein